MTVPSREESARLLLSLDPPAWQLRHARAVAEIAGWLALRVERRSVADERSPDLRRPGAADRRPAVDRGLVEAAALLHDIDKAVAWPARGDGPHGEAGARWLERHGHPELGQAVALHPVTLLVEPADIARVELAPLEARLVAYADKRAGQRLESMAQRFTAWRRRYPHGRGGDASSRELAAAAWDAASRLERAVCGIAGCRPEQVGRLRWTGPALAAARRRPARRVRMAS